MSVMIDASGLTKKFGNLTAIDGLTFSVNEGEVFSLLGPNGAGKTTTVRMLSCLISRTSGDARVGGYDISSKSDALKIRKIIGLLPESPGLYGELTAYDNLDFYAKLYDLPEQARKENIKSLLTMLELWEKKDVAAGTFSKGMQQKLAIARALIHEPKVLFLDEPTSGLDPESAKTVRDFILELKKGGRTIFLNTHNLDEAQRISDRIGILNTKLMALGKPDELERSVGSIRTVVTLQEKPAEHIISSLKGLPVGNVAVDGNRVIIEVKDPETQNPDIISSIVKAGGHIASVVVEKPTLEETYLKLVKRA